MVTHLWRLLHDHANQDRGRLQHEVKAADIARATGLSEALISKWKNKPTLPAPAHLTAIHRKLGVPYRALLDAALTDKGYLPEPGEGAVARGADRLAEVLPRGEDTPRQDRQARGSDELGA